ncbi:MAG: PepSY domain-containing protein [Ignavibacteria bacterium]|nr:PepSY domain-containing protein [Ignavibacteria bacterium]
MNSFFVTFVVALFLFHQPLNAHLSSGHFLTDSTQSHLTSSSDNEITEAISITSLALEGKIIKAEKKFAKERTFWEVEVISPTGSTVELQVSTEEDKILAIIAEEGPFDYELIVGDALKKFSEVRAQAESVSASKVLKWKLVESKSGMQYHFWMFTKGGAAQLKIDAVTGERIMKKSAKKKK